MTPHEPWNDPARVLHERGVHAALRRALARAPRGAAICLPAMAWGRHLRAYQGLVSAVICVERSAPVYRSLLAQVNELDTRGIPIICLRGEFWEVLARPSWPEPFSLVDYDGMGAITPHIGRLIRAAASRLAPTCAIRLTFSLSNPLGSAQVPETLRLLQTLPGRRFRLTWQSVRRATPTSHLMATIVGILTHAQRKSRPVGERPGSWRGALDS